MVVNNVENIVSKALPGRNLSLRPSEGPFLFSAQIACFKIKSGSQRLHNALPD